MGERKSLFGGLEVVTVWWSRGWGLNNLIFKSYGYIGWRAMTVGMEGNKKPGAVAGIK